MEPFGESGKLHEIFGRLGRHQKCFNVLFFCLRVFSFFFFGGGGGSLSLKRSSFFFFWGGEGFFHKITKTKRCDLFFHHKSTARPQKPNGLESGSFPRKSQPTFGCDTQDADSSSPPG